MTESMRNCINSPVRCIGRDSRDIQTRGNKILCCKEEIQDEKDTVLNLIDTIDDCAKDKNSLLKVSSKLSYAAHTINKNDEKELIEVFGVVKRFSLLMHEFQDKILTEKTTSDLVCTFTHEVQKWFRYRFLQDEYPFAVPVQYQSILADINIIEMGLGVCMLSDHYDDSLDDLFF
jgi:hypothetical protein